MKKINWAKLNEWKNKEKWYSLRSQINLTLHRLPRTLFIKYSHSIDLIAIGVGLILASYLVLMLVFKSPVTPDSPGTQRRELSVEMLNKLSGWANERQKEKERFIELSRSGLFK